MTIQTIVALSFVAAILLYFMIYTIIDRICRCIIDVYKLKAYGEIVVNGSTTTRSSEGSSE